MSEHPTLAEVEAAARVLDGIGRLHRWWSPSIPKFDDLDEAGKAEFGRMVEQVLKAAAAARK